MCLAVPAKIVEIDGDNAVIELDGIRRGANVALVHEPKIGEYVIVHAGFAIQKWSDDDVREWSQIMDEMDAVNGRKDKPPLRVWVLWLRNGWKKSGHLPRESAVR